MNMYSLISDLTVYLTGSYERGADFGIIFCMGNASLRGK